MELSVDLSQFGELGNRTPGTDHMLMGAVLTQLGVKPDEYTMLNTTSVQTGDWCLVARTGEHVYKLVTGQLSGDENRFLNDYEALRIQREYDAYVAALNTANVNHTGRGLTLVYMGDQFSYLETQEFAPEPTVGDLYLDHAPVTDIVNGYAKATKTVIQTADDPSFGADFNPFNLTVQGRYIDLLPPLATHGVEYYRIQGQAMRHPYYERKLYTHFDSDGILMYHLLGGAVLRPDLIPHLVASTNTSLLEHNHTPLSGVVARLQHPLKDLIIDLRAKLAKINIHEGAGVIPQAIERQIADALQSL